MRRGWLPIVLVGCACVTPVSYVVPTAHGPTPWVLCSGAPRANVEAALGTGVDRSDGEKLRDVTRIEYRVNGEVISARYREGRLFTLFARTYRARGDEPWLLRCERVGEVSATSMPADEVRGRLDEEAFSRGANVLVGPRLTPYSSTGERETATAYRCGASCATGPLPQ